MLTAPIAHLKAHKDFFIKASKVTNCAVRLLYCHWDGLHHHFSFIIKSTCGVLIKREVWLNWFCKQLEREAWQDLGVPWTVFGPLPESQPLVSSLPADMAYFKSLGLSISPSLFEFMRLVESLSSGSNSAEVSW